VKHNDSKLKAYAELIRLDKPIGIYLLLWPTLWALLIAADGQHNFTIINVFMVGVILMRSAGCAINDFADRHFDGHVERTQYRPIVSGRVSAKEALWVFVLLSLSAFILAVLTLNRLTLLYALIAVALAASYPFTKRYHYFPQVHLGCAFAWAIPMAFVAYTNTHPPLIAWVLFGANLFWTTAYDTMYGISDREHDLKIGVKSTAILFAGADRFIIAILQLTAWLLMFLVGQQLSLQLSYYLCLIAVAILFIYQQTLIKDHHPQRCLQAFLNNHFVGMLVFIGLLISTHLNI
jgi:4-hydroxybenzoate polyprenyltransferase